MRNIGIKNDLIKSAYDCARKHKYEVEHTACVRKLSLELFEDLKALHKLGKEERDLLEAAAILHDIGWEFGKKGHNKRSRDLIMQANLACSKRAKTIIALIARYHRGKLPDAQHKLYCDCNKDTRYIIDACSALIRVADGIDRTHEGIVNRLTSNIGLDTVTITAYGRKRSVFDEEGAYEKADLFECVFKKQLLIAWDV
jgi:exopolyphosphatase/guanosine-5'-triphosphate,3'-diphosphate pyrophosphatase